MFILGINAYHADSAACLVRDGEIVAAAEEERFRRIKHWAGLPTQAISYCLEEGRIRAAEIDYVAINRNPRANSWRRALFLLHHRPALRLVYARVANLFAARSVGAAVGSFLQAQYFPAKVQHVEHHHAHLASAYFASGFDQAVCISVDGCGDFVTTAWGFGNGGITVDGRIYFPHSLGIFYSAITQLLGFRSFGDEYKVMGLAAYGNPNYLSQLHQVLKLEPNGLFRLKLTYFRHHIETICYHWNDCAPDVGTLYTPKLEALLGLARQKEERLEQRHKDIAASAQAIYEDALFALLNAVHKKLRCGNLALAGGCALNSAANGKINWHTPFRSIYVPPAAGDAGGAIGAALVVWQKVSRAKLAQQKSGALGRDRAYRVPESSPRNTQHATRILQSHHAYHGPHFDDAIIECLLRRRGLLPYCARPGTAQSFPDELSNGEFSVTQFREARELCARTARAIADGKIVGWFQGRMEWGPRALGNRSILCDPRRADMKQILNAKIKRRESFRPFAPSILRAHVGEWFEQEADVPFMTSVFQVRREKRALVPAVTHTDGSGRLQTVHAEMNPLFYQLICNFHSLTSVPMVLNTSFNEQEPIVCRPEEALDCFLRTKMDVLVLGAFFVDRQCQA